MWTGGVDGARCRATRYWSDGRHRQLPGDAGQDGRAHLRRRYLRVRRHAEWTSAADFDLVLAARACNGFPTTPRWLGGQRTYVRAARSPFKFRPTQISLRTCRLIAEREPYLSMFGPEARSTPVQAYVWPRGVRPDPLRPLSERCARSVQIYPCCRAVDTSSSGFVAPADLLREAIDPTHSRPSWPTTKPSYESSATTNPTSSPSADPHAGPPPVTCRPRRCHYAVRARYASADLGMWRGAPLRGTRRVPTQVDQLPPTRGRRRIPDPRRRSAIDRNGIGCGPDAETRGYGEVDATNKPPLW